MNTVFTIGHSTHTIDEFIHLLIQHKISAVADVRSKPYSRMFPYFSQDKLKVHLEQAGIGYVFLGYELGGRGQNETEYYNGRVSYRALRQSHRFRMGINRVRKGSKSHTIALLCAEGDPMQCHRGILIAPELTKRGCRVKHILPDGGLESHEQFEERLLAKQRLHSQGLFFSREELLQQAYEKQSRRIAHVKTKQA